MPLHQMPEQPDHYIELPIYKSFLRYLGESNIYFIFFQYLMAIFHPTLHALAEIKHPKLTQ